MQTEFIISAGERPKRLDLFLVHREPKLSRAALQRMIQAGWVRINDRGAKPSRKVKPGDVVRFDSPQPAPLLCHGQAQVLDILYEDPVCLVINKPAGIVCHPGPGHWNDTLLNALLDHVGVTGGISKIGFVHRLDKDTSGLLVVAKTPEAHRRLSGQFEHHTNTRVYEALVHGVPRLPTGLIDRAIGPETGSLTRMTVHTLRPKSSSTGYQVEETFAGRAARLVLMPRTGRTHQIRAHLETVGHPIIGDKVYGGSPTSVADRIPAPRVMLHARRLGFQHPEHWGYCEFEVEAPKDFQSIRGMLRLLAPGAPKS
ncbi:MAG: RluA family pseudouridine synthase [Nitrospira sp. CR2.1]|nr:RluA family pseudouridine synthase [Nitrospira sp. CR2.1]